MQICVCDDVEQISFDAFVPYVSVNIAGVPSNVIAHNARLAAIEFAQTSGLLRRTVFLDAYECVNAYHFEMDDCYTMLSIKQVCCGETRLYPQRNLECCPTGSCTYYFERPNKLYIGLAPACDQEQGIEIHASVSPGQDSCSIDKWVYDLYAEAIAMGAMYRILSMPDEEWTNSQAATMHGRNFNAAVSKALTSDRAAHSSEPTRMAMPGGFFV